jgi:hypothetical protein
MSDQTAPADSPAAPRLTTTALRMWARAYRAELVLFALSFFILASFSSFRFLRQSAAPHFVYQAQAWLEGRADVDAAVLPNLEDWACVREAGGVRKRCEGTLLPSDRWYSSFPSFPSVVMLPFVALNGYQFNDTSFGVLIGALAVALLYSLFRQVSEHQGTGRSELENGALALLLGFGTLFFYASIRGEVWFSAEVMGVALTALYVRNALGARQAELAGLFWSMAVLTRTPLVFTIVFFLVEAVCPTKGGRVDEVRRFLSGRAPEAVRRVGRFLLGALPLGLLGALYNFERFGSVTEFGHRFFFNNRVNADIDTYGLFHARYLLRNLDAAFLKLPLLSGNPVQLGYDAWGLSLFLTLPLLALAFVPKARVKQAVTLVGLMAGTLLLSGLLPNVGPDPLGNRSVVLWLALCATIGTCAWFALQWIREANAPRLLVPVALTLIITVLPGLFYQNTGYAQFGFRFSLDYTPYVFLLLALSGWNFRRPLPLALATLSVIVNFWGAVAFRGYTELVRSWP